MTQLLNANLARLFRSRLFYICAAISAALGTVKIVSDVFTTNIFTFANNREIHLFRTYGFENLIITAIFICLFIGKEYDGGMRNKIISGKKRLSVYLANLITCSAAATIFYALFAGCLLITFVFCGEIFVLPISQTALYLLLQLFSILGAGAIFTLLAMLIHHKAASAVISLVLLFGLFITENYSSMRIYDINISINSEEELTDTELAEISALTFVRNANPFGQQAQLESSYSNEIYKAENPRFADNEQTPLQIVPYSSIMIAASTAIGVLAFRKKNIK